MQVNRITGNIDWKAKTADPVWRDGYFDDGRVSIRSERVPVHESCTSVWYDPEQEVACSFLGYILNREEICSAHGLQWGEETRIILDLYHKTGPDFLYLLDGIFMILVYDRKAGRLLVFTDSFGFVLPLYYQNGDALLFSTSLKELLAFSRIRPVINPDAVRDLLFTRKCIPNELTLVEGVTKLPAGFIMNVDLGKKEIKTLRASWKVKKVPREEAKRQLIGKIRENVARLMPFTGKHIACTLSSGFDTNLLLHFLAGTSGQPVATYTIGGDECDEIPRVKKIIQTYPSVSARYAHVAADKLDHLPDIVWHLEGYLFERGIYLMDELGKLLHSFQEQLVFTGEGGDGLFSSYKNVLVQKMRMQLLGTFTGYLFYRFIRPIFHLNSPEVQVLKKLRRSGFHSRFSKTRDLNLKKLGILLNAHGVMSLNPLLSFEYRAYCKALGKNLSRNKQFYKREIRKIVPRELAGILIKLGGTTDIWYILEPYLHLLDPLLQSEISRQLISRRDLRRIRNHPERYQVLIHQLFYIYTFKELFLSGKYDFSKPTPGVTLSGLFASSQPV